MDWPPKLSPDQCQPVSPQKEESLLRYVRKLLRATDNDGIKTIGSSLNKRTCYRRFQFAVPGQPSSVYDALSFASDQRFLAPQVFDASVDPAEEQQEDQRRVKSEIDAYVLSRKPPVLGPINAPVTIAVFGDFQCPFCARGLKVLMKDILPAYRDRVRVAYIQFPLPGHPWARAAAEVMTCIASQSQDLFWQMHSFIYDHQSEIKATTLQSKIIGAARPLVPDFDLELFNRCLTGKGSATLVDGDVTFGTNLQISGTPTLFINGLLVDGARDAAQLTALIDSQLTETGSVGPLDPKR